MMIWFFERGFERLHYEIRQESGGDRYELVITYPDGSRGLERFGDPASLMDRAVHLQHRLRAEGWRPPAVRDRRRSLS
jgi:hypothetical protein